MRLFLALAFGLLTWRPLFAQQAARLYRVPAVILPAGAPALALPGLMPGPGLLPPPTLPSSALPPATPAAYGPVVAQVSLNIESQLAAMEASPISEKEKVLPVIASAARGLLQDLDGLVKSGAIDPDLETVAADRPWNVGFYPVSGDPLHWGHLIEPLKSISRLHLDKVFFRFQGQDARKPNMTPLSTRLSMAQAVLSGFKPFFEALPMEFSNSDDGEANLFRFLAAFPHKKMHVSYLVGDDHYKLKDKNGNDDTIRKIEKNMADPDLGFDPALHQVSLAFLEREGHSQDIPTDLDVRFVPGTPFQSSSTAVRKGQYAFMPFAAYDWVRKNAPGLYGILPN